MCHQGLPLRGHGDEQDSNFTQLLMLQSENNEKLAIWMQRKTDKYTSPEIQNEILKIMSEQVLSKCDFLFA